MNLSTKRCKLRLRDIYNIYKYNNSQSASATIANEAGLYPSTWTFLFRITYYNCWGGGELLLRI